MPRKAQLQAVGQLLATNPVVGVLGARQIGKTTLALQLAETVAGGSVHRFDLEDPGDLARLQDPKLALESLRGTVILDEIQRRASAIAIRPPSGPGRDHCQHELLLRRRDDGAPARA